ncbi:MAG: KpsF/GutQ family sugar-phosphate isomerase [Proteobacteria bacterium]|nr:KpsF/GutQ family sugar-phosphate isomerase [Pseudomonadota bacterium]
MATVNAPPHDHARLLSLGRSVLEIESRAISDLAKEIDHTFAEAAEIMLGCRGRIVVLGMGKSGHIGSKIAATLASTGSPAFFVHPGEASHGDMGMITVDDVVLALSNSGETDEIVILIPLIRRLGVPLVAMTGNGNSNLAKQATVHIDVGVKEEACPLGLAPTSSTTAALAMGDALAIAMLQARGFTEEDFALSHPGGALGRRLLLKISGLIHTGQEMPVVTPETSVAEALVEITQKGLGMTAVVAPDSTVLGIFTDGDLRRVIDQRFDINTTSISEVMTTQCTMVNANILAADALRIMQDGKFNALLVIDSERRLTGVLNMHDLLRSRVF